MARTSISPLAATALLLAVTALASAPAVAAARPSCVGAAARDAKRPCFNATRAVTPSLAKADLVRGSPCRLTDEQPEPVCTFGAPRSRATKQIALVGDSHALQWRSALDFVAASQGWQGYSLTTPGCPFSDVIRYLPDGFREFCEPWYRGVGTWLRNHPEVTTVYVSSIVSLALELPPGKTELEVKSAGFRRAWASLPKTVTRLIVIRDTPQTTEATPGCLRGVIAAGRERPGIACKLPRAAMVLEDAAVTTARKLRSRRFAFADLTSFFCNSAFCYPVIGGVLVHRDTLGHITPAFAQTLGPYLLRRLRFLGEAGQRPARARQGRYPQP